MRSPGLAHGAGDEPGRAVEEMDLTGHGHSLRGGRPTGQPATPRSPAAQTARRAAADAASDEAVPATALGGGGISRTRRRRCRSPAARTAGSRCSVTTETEAGSTTIRWNRSRCRPSASARIALITSPWLQASQTASGPAPRRPWRPTPGRPRPRGPGSGPAPPPRPGEHRRRRVLLHHLPQRFLDQLLERPAGPVAVARLAQPVVRLHRRSRPAARASAVCRQRSSGLVTTAASGTGASRSATAAAWRAAALVQVHPRVCPASTGPVFAVVPVPDEQDGGHGGHSSRLPPARPG